jgi:hypothetical protein
LVFLGIPKGPLPILPHWFSQPICGSIYHFQLGIEADEGSDVITSAWASSRSRAKSPQLSHQESRCSQSNQIINTGN